MELKIYSQKNCKYCDDIKKALEENKIEFETVEIDDNRDEWNEITRIIGIGMTPTIKFKEEIWVPSRDFRGAEELIKRLEYYKEYPLAPPTPEEKTEMILNASKNLAMSIQQINMTLSNMQNKLNQLTRPQPKKEGKESLVEETTTK